jgi:hypothetical protein
MNNLTQTTAIPQKGPACSLPPLPGSGWKTSCLSLLLLLRLLLKGEFTLHSFFVTHSEAYILIMPHMEANSGVRNVIKSKIT